MTRAQSATLSGLSGTVFPGVFVVLWSTGFIGAKLGLPYIEPFTFLMIRFAILVVILALAAVLWRAPWPSTWGQVGHLGVVGVLVHGVYLGGVFSAIAAGLSAGVVALIVGMQPLLTAAGAGVFLGERIRPRQWLGLVLGLVGVVMVVADKLGTLAPGGRGVGFSVVALVAITTGTLYQKRHGGALDLRSGSAIQYLFALLPIALMAWFFETGEVRWNPELVFALGWLVVVLSLGALSMLFVLIRKGAASEVASLFYLTPPLTALIAWVWFDETLSATALMGMGVVGVGVALVTRKP